MKKIKQQSGMDDLQERSDKSRELLKREMLNYNALWKNKENNAKRSISYKVAQKCRDEWKMPLLIKEAEEENEKDKYFRKRRI